jgi:hypothetical protein
MDDGYRFPYGVPLVLYPLLAIGIASGSGKWWGMVLAVLTLMIGILAAREGLSRRSFEEEHAKHPTLNLLTWRVNWLAFFALPALFLALFPLARSLLRLAA